MRDKLLLTSKSSLYWILLVALGLSLEAVALYYQYVLDEWPCVLCIHVRIWISGFTLVALLTLFIHKSWVFRVAAHSVVTLMMVGLLERSYILLGVERGTIMGSCDMNSGLPDWFALDRWFPVLFEIKTTCGYTPELLFGITMAEALMVFSSVMVLVSGVMTIVSFSGRKL